MKTPTIKIAPCDELYDAHDIQVGGDADLDEHEIRLCAGVVDYQEIIDTLIHETLHLVLVKIDEREASHAIDNTYEDYHDTFEHECQKMTERFK